MRFDQVGLCMNISLRISVLLAQISYKGDLRDNVTDYICEANKEKIKDVLAEDMPFAKHFIIIHRPLRYVYVFTHPTIPFKEYPIEG